MQSQIEKFLLDIEDKQIHIPREEYKDAADRLDKCEAMLRERIKGDEELERLFKEYDIANEYKNSELLIKYYREGFISGVKVALEVSGWKLPKD